MAPYKRGQLLARVNFPPYTVHVISERHILVAGGGGQAKTGVPNIIEIYELINTGTTCRAESVLHYDTGREVIMNCCVMHNGRHFVLAAGMGGSCQIYQMKYKILKDDDTTQTEEPKCAKENGVNKSQGSVRRRRRTNSQLAEEEDGPCSENIESDSKKKKKSWDTNGNVLDSKISFELMPLDMIQTDFSSSDLPYQKIVRFTLDHSVMVTAGADGHIRTWKYPELSKLYEIKAHENEVDDLDITPSGDKIVSVSRDGHGYFWSMKDGQKICELKYSLPKDSSQKYIFRGCRLGVVEGDSSNAHLFTTLIPQVRQKPPLPCYLFKWNSSTFAVEKAVPIGADVPSALAVSADGKFVGTGSLTGAVDIFIAFSLQRLYHVEKAHSIFVTGLEFLHCSEETQRITGDMDASLVSISVDNHIVVHHIPKQSTTGLVGIVIFFVIFLLLIYVLMDFLHL